MSSNVGAVALPLDASDPELAVLDPVCVGIASFLAHFIRAEAGAKLVLQKPTVVTDALPEANVHTFDPGARWVRLPTPALYVWWTNKSQSTVREYSLIHDIRERQLRLMYVHSEITG